MGSFSFLFKWRNAVWKRLNSRAMAWSFGWRAVGRGDEDEDLGVAVEDLLS
jgi:hypothetical protein